MSKITAEEILDEVRAIMAKARNGSNGAHLYISSYNVLSRISALGYATLVADHGPPGKGAGSHHSAAQVVKNALKMLSNNDEVEIIYAHSNGENWYEIHGEKIQPGNATIGMYRYVGKEFAE